MRVAFLANLRGDIEGARAAIRQALQAAREANLASHETKALNILGFIDTAKPELQAGVARARASGDTRALVSSLTMLGHTCVLLGDIDEARLAFEECGSLSSHGGATALFGLARAALAAGQDESPSSAAPAPCRDWPRSGSSTRWRCGRSRELALGDQQNSRLS